MTQGRGLDEKVSQIPVPTWVISAARIPSLFQAPLYHSLGVLQCLEH